MKKQTDKVITGSQVKKILGSDQSKSKKIKDLFDGGLELKDIATHLNIRYNFVYNVISNYVNTSDQPITVIKKDNTESKKDKIIKLYQDNKSLKEISIELKTNYNYVFNTVKQYKQQNNG